MRDWTFRLSELRCDCDVERRWERDWESEDRVVEIRERALLSGCREKLLIVCEMSCKVLMLVVFEGGGGIYALPSRDPRREASWTIEIFETDNEDEA